MSEKNKGHVRVEGKVIYILMILLNVEIEVVVVVEKVELIGIIFMDIWMKWDWSTHYFALRHFIVTFEFLN